MYLSIRGVNSILFKVCKECGSQKCEPFMPNLHHNKEYIQIWLDVCVFVLFIASSMIRNSSPMIKSDILMCARR